MLRYNQPYPPQVRKIARKNASQHLAQLHHTKEIKPELLSHYEEEFFLALQSRLPH